MLVFINKRSMMFNFKTFKIILLATINSIIVTVSFLLNLYIVLLLIYLFIYTYLPLTVYKNSRLKSTIKLYNSTNK